MLGIGYIISSPDPNAQRSAYRKGVEPACARPSVRASVNNFKQDQRADRNQNLPEASLGWGKSCKRFWARPDQNPGFHGSR